MNPAPRRQRGAIVGLTLVIFVAFLAWGGARQLVAVTSSDLTFGPTADTYVQKSSATATAGSARTIYADNSPVKNAL